MTPARARPPAVWRAALERRPRTTAFGLGAVATLALPPLGLWPLLVVFAGLLHLVRRAPGVARAFGLGWCFGLGHFLFGLYWIAIAFFTDAERFGALAVPAVVGLCAYLAVYPGLATGLTGLVRWRSGSAAALALAIAWTVAEVLRGTLFGGFPWNLIGYAFADSAAISQLAALTGVLGLSFVAVALGALPAGLLEPGGARRAWPPLVGVGALALIALGGALRLAGAEPATVPGLKLRLVQGNIAQHHKWQPELRARWFQRYLELSATDPDGVAHVIWPESATPYRLEQDPVARRLVAEVAPAGGFVLTGGDRFDLEQAPPRAWNSLFVIDGEATIRARYDKQTLVPFGEFLPLRGILSQLGLEKLTAGSIDFQAGPGRTTIALPGLPPFGPLICYEAIFPGQVVADGARPAWLLNVTNDAWFGQSSGPYQHLAMARMRALEEGLPLVRSANTGISAVVDPWGRIQARLALGETGVLDVALPTPLATPTPYARWRPWPLLALLTAAALAAGALETAARRHRNG